MNNTHQINEVGIACVRPTTDQMHQLIQCPFCDGTYHHVMRVGTELDPSEDEITIYEGTDLIFNRLDSAERRSAVRIDFHGECGHYWSLILQQHKGMMEFYARRMEPPPLSVDAWVANYPEAAKACEKSHLRAAFSSLFPQDPMPRQRPRASE